MNACSVKCGECPAYRPSPDPSTHYCGFMKALNTVNADTACELRASGITLAEMEAEAVRHRALAANVRWDQMRRVYSHEADYMEAAVKLHKERAGEQA